MISDKYLSNLIGKRIEAFLVENGKAIGIKGILKEFDATTIYITNEDLGDTVVDRGIARSITVRKETIAPAFDPDNMGSFLATRRGPLRGNGR